MKTLSNLKVIDLSHAGAMPFAAMILADSGADVIKIESFKGDHFRYALKGSIMASLNRNKRGVVINLKEPEGKKILCKLIEKSDVFLENFVPGAMEKLGFGYTQVANLNPRIIYASISGFGQSGPLRHLPGYDVIAQAMSGIMMATGEKDRKPVRIGTSCIDFGSGMWAALGVLLALIDREKTGRGQHIDVSLLETGIAWMTHFVTQFSISGEVPQRLGTALPFLSPYQVFEAKDGYVFIGVSTDEFWKHFCTLFDLKNIESLDKFKTNNDRVNNREELVEILIPIIKSYTTTGILEKLKNSGIPHGPLLSVNQIIENEQIQSRSIIENINHPEYGDIKLVKTPVFRDGKIPEIIRPSPMLGQHTSEVLNELGYSKEEIEDLCKNSVVLTR